tara:strand:- start:28653 stop:29558 length:906 start_codon:yes stop_codon:yes gene_type:complete
MTSLSDKPNVLLVGATGQVGHEIALQAEAFGIAAATPLRSELDITDEASIREALELYRPDIVINAAAYTNVDRAEAETDLAFSVNGTGPALLAAACEAAQTPIFHISTDYVFDGTSPAPYRENDEINPLNAYGRSKAAGEQAIRLATKRHIIVRTSWVFGSRGTNFVKSILQRAETNAPLKVVSDEWGNPTGASDIGKLLLFLSVHCLKQISMGEDPTWGTYHFCNDMTVTRHQFAEVIIAGAAKRGRPECAIIPITSSALHSNAQRPRNSSLDCALIKETFGIQTRSWKPCLEEILDQIL